MMGDLILSYALGFIAGFVSASWFVGWSESREKGMQRKYLRDISSTNAPIHPNCLCGEPIRRGHEPATPKPTAWMGAGIRGARASHTILDDLEPNHALDVMKGAAKVRSEFDARKALAKRKTRKAR